MVNGVATDPHVGVRVGVRVVVDVGVGLGWPKAEFTPRHRRKLVEMKTTHSLLANMEAFND